MADTRLLLINVYNSLLPCKLIPPLMAMTRAPLDSFSFDLYIQSKAREVIMDGLMK